MERRRMLAAAGAALLWLFSFAAEANDYRIILVHGFSGWGRDEVFGMKYWGGGFGTGGSRDLEVGVLNPILPTRTAAVGPISSNWDRAIELFYQIKGGCVDYGPWHSTHLELVSGGFDTRTHVRKMDGGFNADGTQRPRKCWRRSTDPNNGDPVALFEQWGDTPAHKVHFIAHSQGGQTVRVLLDLLRRGAPNETAADSSLLNETTQKNPFTGGKNWVSSVSTFATPHDGTTLATGAQLLPMVQQLVGAAAGFAGLASSDPVIFDLKLQQWGLKRNPGETFGSYFSRVNGSAIWNTSKDVSLWDLSPDGAREHNLETQHFNDVYYFSFATGSTFRGVLSGRHYPTVTTFLPFQPQSLFMGWFTRNDPNKVPIDGSWWENDSVVNTRSMRSPTIGNASPVVNWGGAPHIGAWNHMGKIAGYDHVDVIGVLCLTCNINPIYSQHANLLKTLTN